MVDRLISLFRRKEKETQVTISSGGTLFMPGLIQKYLKENRLPFQIGWTIARHGEPTYYYQVMPSLLGDDEPLRIIKLEHEAYAVVFKNVIKMGTIYKLNDSQVIELRRQVDQFEKSETRKMLLGER